jgi:hypothetical protein
MGIGLDLDSLIYQTPTLYVYQIDETRRSYGAFIIGWWSKGVSQAYSPGIEQLPFAIAAIHIHVHIHLHVESTFPLSRLSNRQVAFWGRIRRTIIFSSSSSSSSSSAWGAG